RRGRIFAALWPRSRRPCAGPDGGADLGVARRGGGRAARGEWGAEGGDWRAVGGAQWVAGGARRAAGEGRRAASDGRQRFTPDGGIPCVSRPTRSTRAGCWTR